MKKIILKSLLSLCIVDLVFAQAATQRPATSVGGGLIAARQPSIPVATTQASKSDLKSGNDIEFLSPFYERKAERFSDKDISYVNSDVVFSLSAEDSKTGIHHSEYALDDEPFKLYTTPFTVRKEGNVLLRYRAVDNSGNIEKTVLNQIYVDNTAPQVEIGTDRGVFQKNDYLYCSKRLKFYINAKDDDSGSGVRATYAGVSMDKMRFRGTGISSEKNFFSVADGVEGIYEFYYTAIDNVGNLAEIKKYNIVVDNTPPIVDIDKNHWINMNANGMMRNKNLNIKKDAVIIIPDKVKKNTFYVNGNHEIAFKAIDPKIGVFDGSDVAAVYIKINDEDFVKYKGPVKFQKSESYKITVRAEDNVGNISQDYEFFFILDFERPKSTLTFKNPEGQNVAQRGAKN